MREGLSSALIPSADSYTLGRKEIVFLCFRIRELKYDFPHAARNCQMNRFSSILVFLDPRLPGDDIQLMESGGKES